ncbi:MAG: hypothetical protein ACPGQS_04880, partial [Bradymonadia bacterium]
MSFVTPLFLFSAIALPLYLWLLRRRDKDANVPFTGGFLVEEAPGAGGEKRLVTLSLEDLLNCLLLFCLVLAGANFSTNTQNVILTDGPIQLEESFRGSPLIRAGIHPSVFSDSSAIPPVDTPPNWTGAIRFAQQHFPGHETIYRTSKSTLSEIRGAGIRRTGNDWQLGVQTAQTDVRVVDSNANDVMMRTTFGGLLSAELGLVDWISVSAGEERPHFICGPGAGRLELARGRLPLVLEQGLALHPAITIVDEGGVFEREPATSEVSRHDDALRFPIRRIAVSFQKATRFDPVELSLVDGLNLPVAQAYRWTELKNSGVPFLFGDQHTLIAYYRDGDVGRLIFGFEPKDSDLIETAGWPVLMLKIGDYLLEQSRSCREVILGQVVSFNASGPVRVVSPDGVEQTLTPANGVISISGLDQVGKYRVFDEDHSMWLMVRDVGQGKRDVPTGTLLNGGSPASPATVNYVSFVSAVCVLLALLVFGNRRWWYFGALALLLMVPLSEKKGFGRVPKVAVLMDVSPSMKDADVELNTLSKLTGVLPQRVDVADDIIRLSKLTDPINVVASSMNVEQILERIDKVDIDADEFVLITDARFPLSEISYSKPVSVLTVPMSGIDLRIVAATVVEMNEGLYVRAILETPGAIDGQLLVGGKQKKFSFSRGGEFSVSALMPRTERDVEVIEVESPMDSNISNNRLHVVVERPGRSDALVLGRCDSSLRKHLSKFHRIIGFDGVGDFSNVQLTVICDQVLSAIPQPILGGLSRWLENGGTLILMGREAAFGNGNWAQSELETVAPFRMRPKDKRSRTHLSVALDTSGSMSEKAGGSGANAFVTVVPQWLSSMLPNDRISVASFDSQITTIVDNQSVKQWRSEPWSVPTSMGGGTRFSSVVDWTVKTPIIGMHRYLLLVSDGEFADQKERAVHIERLRRSGIRVLSVGAGDNANYESLCTIARSTEGQCLAAGDSRVGR